MQIHGAIFCKSLAICDYNVHSNVHSSNTVDRFQDSVLIGGGSSKSIRQEMFVHLLLK